MAQSPVGAEAKGVQLTTLPLSRPAHCVIVRVNADVSISDYVLRGESGTGKNGVRRLRMAVFDIILGWIWNPTSSEIAGSLARNQKPAPASYSRFSREDCGRSVEAWRKIERRSSDYRLASMIGARPRSFVQGNGHVSCKRKGGRPRRSGPYFSISAKRDSRTKNESKVVRKVDA